jgi:hypothetical protein
VVASPSLSHFYPGMGPVSAGKISFNQLTTTDLDIVAKYPPILKNKIRNIQLDFSVVINITGIEKIIIFLKDGINPNV